MKFSISAPLPPRASNLNDLGYASRSFVLRGPRCKVCLRSDPAMAPVVHVGGFLVVPQALSTSRTKRLYLLTRGVSATWELGCVDLVQLGLGRGDPVQKVAFQEPSLTPCERDPRWLPNSKA
jgi:hypothetical protein